MSERIIPLPEDRHAEAQALLPWFVTGGLESAERARLDHHLQRCAECRADLRLERRLRAQVAELELAVEQDWASMRGRIAAEAQARRRALGWRSRWWRWAPGAAPWLGWAAAPLALALVLVAVVPPPRPATYHALSAPVPPSAANIVVVFRPDAREADLRAALNAADARIVGGPTAADAYELRVPPARRATALARLRRRLDVVLAEPIDAPGPT